MRSGSTDGIKDFETTKFFFIQTVEHWFKLLKWLLQ